MSNALRGVHDLFTLDECSDRVTTTKLLGVFGETGSVSTMRHIVNCKYKIYHIVNFVFTPTQ